ncbi:MAG TPA: hypothetical protein VKA24_07280 [Gaiellaceae bacterium]|nr:hypothetical protein [Gaiellaceae bacterium]
MARVGPSKIAEHAVARSVELLEEGWAGSPGERYRFQIPPGVRITTTELEPKDAADLAGALATALQSPQATYAA